MAAKAKRGWSYPVLSWCGSGRSAVVDWGRAKQVEPLYGWHLGRQVQHLSDPLKKGEQMDELSEEQKARRDLIKQRAARLRRIRKAAPSGPTAARSGITRSVTPRGAPSRFYNPAESIGKLITEALGPTSSKAKIIQKAGCFACGQEAELPFCRECYLRLPWFHKKQVARRVKGSYEKARSWLKLNADKEKLDE